MPLNQPPAEPYSMSLPNEKDQLGEILYALVEKKNSANASKITGMLLEMEVDQIQSIIKDQSQLDKWIDEALKVICLSHSLGAHTAVISRTLTHHSPPPLS